MLKNPKYLYGSRDVNIRMNINFADDILGKCASYGDKVALVNVETGNEITFSKLVQQSINLGVSFSQLGIRKGQTVAICSENRTEYFPCVFGASSTGAVVTPLGVHISKDEMKHLLSISKPTLIICTDITYKTHSKTWKSTPHVKKLIRITDTKPKEDIWYQDLVSKNVSNEDFIPADVDGMNDTAFILYSSGTTGLPKGVKISHYNALVCCNTFIQSSDGLEIRALAVSPWYHAMGFWGTIMSIRNGRFLTIMNKFDEKMFLSTIDKYKVNILTVPPPVVVWLTKTELLSQYDVSSVLLIFCGAAPLDIETINDVSKRFPSLLGVMQGYGMTESTMAISRDSEMAPAGLKPKSVGVVIAGTIIKIVDIETRKPLGPMERGEICAKGPTIMQGYVGQKPNEHLDSEGFYATGDIGYYDEDKYLYIVDRLKELIKYKGYQVPPAELEAVLLQHKAVRDAAVIGKPDRAAGELPLAFVALQPGETATADEIRDFVDNQVSNPKKLRGGVRFIKEIPKNPSGKILRKDLRKLLKAGKSKL